MTHGPRQDLRLLCRRSVCFRYGTFSTKRDELKIVDLIKSFSVLLTRIQKMNWSWCARVPVDVLVGTER